MADESDVDDKYLKIVAAWPDDYDQSKRSMARELLRRREADRWIPVSERLPEAGVWVHSFRSGEKDISRSRYLGNGEWAGPYGHTTVTSHAYLPPTHWMPLPAAPALASQGSGE